MSGLAGLGVLNQNNASATVESPVVMSSLPVAKGSGITKLVPLVSTAREPQGLSIALKLWFSKLQEFVVKEIQMPVEGLDMLDVFMVEIPELTASYLIVPAATNEVVTNTFSSVCDAQNKFQSKAVCVITESLMENVRKDSNAKHVDIMDMDDMQNIDAAAFSTVMSLNAGNKFSDVVAKLLNKKYKSANSQAFIAEVQSDLVDTGNNLKDAFTEGFNQLSSSITAGLAALKGMTSKQTNTALQSDKSVVASDSQQNAIAPAQVFSTSDVAQTGDSFAQTGIHTPQNGVIPNANESREESIQIESPVNLQKSEEKV